MDILTERWTLPGPFSQNQGTFMNFKKEQGKRPLLLRAWKVAYKNVVLETLQYSQKNTCVGGFRPAILLRETPTQVLSCEYCNEYFLQNNSGWLLLDIESENISRCWLTYSLQEEYRNNYFEKHCRDCYQLVRNGTLMRKTFYLVNFVVIWTLKSFFRYSTMTSIALSRIC